MTRRLKASLITFGIIALLAAILTGLWLWFTRQALPKVDGRIQVEGLAEAVDVVRDEYGVAHIYAQNTPDLFFAQGYVHAQERFWQMEFQRRTGAGRLSEIFGETTVSTDRYLRHFGFSALVEEIYQNLEPETQVVLQAYAAGVNAYIQDRTPGQLGLEFAMLNLQGVRWEIEPWQPTDALLWTYMMIYDQGGSPSSPVNELATLATVGTEMYDTLNPPYREDRPTIISPDDFELEAEAALPSRPTLDPDVVEFLVSLYNSVEQYGPADAQLADLGFQMMGGSNSFVVSGEKTSTGLPLLANDPHMGVLMPSIWYQVGMHCAPQNDACPYNFRGYSLPGIPGILIGHNDKIAWGLTNASFDAEDVFIEKINPENPNQYEVNDEWEEMDIRYEQIFVQGQDDPVVVVVRNTRNGVVASDAMVSQAPFSYNEDGPELYALSYAWTALEPVYSIQAVLNVLTAQNYDDFVDALEEFQAGKQNWLYADIEGNIGYVLPGRIPIRAGGDGTLPVPGWTDDYLWDGYIPYDEMPRVLNPTSGYIVTANNPQLPQSAYPYLLAAHTDKGQRAQRLTDLVANATEPITPNDMQIFQTDNVSLSALEIIPYLEDLEFDDQEVAAARDSLLGWDGDMTMDSSEAALFNYFFMELINTIFDDQLPSRYAPGAASNTSDVIYHLLNDPRDAWWDDARTPERVEDRYDMLARAFEVGYAVGVSEQGDNIEQWQWGEMHTIFFEHATLGRSGIGLIENIFNRGPFPVNGSESVPQKTCWRSSNPFTVSCIPAMRQVIDLNDLDNSVMIHSVGQSGHPMSPHYDDMIETWRTFGYLPTNWSRTDAEQGGNTLTLEP